MEAVTNFKQVEFTFQWTISSWQWLKRATQLSHGKSACSQTLKKDDVEMKFGVHFDGRKRPTSNLTFFIRLLSHQENVNAIVFSAAYIRHGWSNGPNASFQECATFSLNSLMVRNEDLEVRSINELDIKGEKIKLEARFAVTYNPESITENCKQLVDQSMSTDLERKLCEDLASLNHSSSHSDFEIKVDDSTFSGHKAIFAARSPVFAAMFEHPMKEKSSSCVKIEDTDAATWQRFQDFIYSGRIQLEGCSIEENGSIIGLADKYQVKSLFDHVAEKLEKVASLDNFFDVFDISCKFELSNVQSYLTNIYRNNKEHFTSETVKSEVIERLKKNPSLGNIILDK